VSNSSRPEMRPSVHSAEGSLLRQHSDGKEARGMCEGFRPPDFEALP
jgi:hypothetical protein